MLANSSCEPSAEKARAEEKRRTAKNCSMSGSFRVFVTATARRLQFSSVERSLPWAWYADADVLRREGERIFARSWQYAGHLGQIGETGGFFAATAGQIPVVVTRARDGELRAFLNVCRHRGHVVASGSGERETLQCPYHAWTYGLDGRLRAAPRSDREPGFDTDELGLKQIQVDTWGPFVFVNPDPEAVPLADALGDVPTQLAEILDVNVLEFRFRDRVRARRELEDLLRELPRVLPLRGRASRASAQQWMSPRTPIASPRLGSCRARSGRCARTATRSSHDGEVPRSQFHFLWPNFGLNVFPGHPNLSCGPMLPLGPERTGRFLDYFFAPEVDQEWIDELIAFDNQVGTEDRALVEGVQRGVRSGILTEGRVLSESEQLVAHFQRLCAEALAG